MCLVYSYRGEGKRRKTRDPLSTREAVLLPGPGAGTREDAERWREGFEKANPGPRTVAG